MCFPFVDQAVAKLINFRPILTVTIKKALATKLLEIIQEILRFGISCRYSPQTLEFAATPWNRHRCYSFIVCVDQYLPFEHVILRVYIFSRFWIDFNPVVVVEPFSRSVIIIVQKISTFETWFSTTLTSKKKLLWLLVERMVLVYPMSKNCSKMD